jgi:phospholipase C
MSSGSGGVAPVSHVFVLMLENHSFDNIFAFSGIPGIRAATSSNCNSYSGANYCVHSPAPSSMPSDPGHEFADVLEQLAGVSASYPPGGPYPPIDNSGFAANYVTSTTEGPAPPAADIGDIMACFDTPTELPVIYQLATEFALCDQWFASLPGPTWPNRFFVHGASSAGLDHSPSTDEILEWETVDGFRYPHGSIYDALNRANISWGLYHDVSGPIAGSLAQVSSIHNISIFDVSSLSDFQSALHGDYPHRYTFIEPNYGDVTGTYEGGSSQHPMDGMARGEALIKKVYEAIRNSPIWNSSLLVVTYDEHGGFYDYYAPGAALPPNDGSSSTYNQSGFNFAQYGVRVPAVIVSPWIAKGQVDHTVYDHSSVAATLEALFGFSALTARDASANNALHLLSSKFRTDCPKTLNNPAAVRAMPLLKREEQISRDAEAVPRRGNLPPFLATALKIDLELSSGDPAERAAIIANFRTVQTRGQARAYIATVLTRAAIAKSRRPRPAIAGRAT